MKKLLLLSGVALIAMSVTASAGTINLRLQQDGGVVEDHLGAPGQSTFSATDEQFHDFLISNITGSTSPSTTFPNLLSSNTLNIQNTATGSHNLKIWVTGTGLTDPTGLSTLFSGFTSNAVSNQWQIGLQTLFDPNNGLFGGSLIDQAFFVGVPLPTSFASDKVNTVDLGPGPYSLTAFFNITSAGPGQANSSISLSATPVPGPIVGAGIPGLLSALSLVGLAWRRRRRNLDLA